MMMSWLSIGAFAILVGLILAFTLSNTGFIYLLKKWWRLIEDKFHVYQFYKVPERDVDESFHEENELYRKVSTYVSSLPSIEESEYANLFSGKTRKEIEISVRLDKDQAVHDVFLGARVSWKKEENGRGLRSFVLKIKKKDKRRILQQYLQHVHRVADEIGSRRKEIKLYTNTGGGGGVDHRWRWRSVHFTHPSTFETIAMDADLKARIKADLEAFLKSKQYYHRLGRVWKRSYLLFGPSGTGKSSFVAAVAKLLSYDIYDLDLSKVSSDSDLKSTLLQTSTRSLILIEDLDRLFLNNNNNKTNELSLVSGLVNYLDGIHSFCGEERVVIITMKNKELVEPWVMRPGRIDAQIYFPLCDFPSFKSLASNYLGLKDHKLFPQVEEMFQIAGPTMSPAEIGEIMIANRTSPSRALKTVISALQTTASTHGRRLTADGAPSGEDSGADHSGVICRESVHTVREFRHRKLYGLLRLKSSRKSNGFYLNTEEKPS
ncbi:hypothetical protein Sjap_005627 [Stephania japonica]|uniref:AAA+ ATPase domain-containing protein n=1 Tax=Stephania japonica TaxID=461633 RepID=A0AAP0K5Y0_9MAGN